MNKTRVIKFQPTEHCYVYMYDLLFTSCSWWTCNCETFLQYM